MLRERLGRFWRPETGIFFALWLYLLAVGRTRLLLDPDTFWHTQAGEKILSSGSVLHADPFCFNPPNRPWVLYEWLAECLMALMHRIDGLDTLVLGAATLLAGLYTWVAHRLIRAGVHWLPVGFLIMLVVGASASHFHPRPHLATLVFLGVTFAWLCDFEAGRIGLSRLFWLLPIYVVWSNLHGGMLGGLAMLIAAGGGWLGYWLFRREAPLKSGRGVLEFGLLILACGLTSLVNPYGVALPSVWFKILTSEDVAEVIKEHAPLDPFELTGLSVLLLAALYFVILLNVRVWPRVTWLLPFLWLYEACLHIRHGSLFALTAGLTLADVIPQTRWAAGQVRSGGDLFAAASKALPAFGFAPLLLPVIAVLVALALQAGRIEVPLIGHGWARLDPELWPEELRGELEELNRSRPEGTPIFNDLTYGGYLTYRTPRLRIFVDGRCEVHDSRWLKEYVDADRDCDTAKIEAWQKRWPFDLALVRSGSGFDKYFHNTGWTEVKRTNTATLYRRNEFQSEETTPRGGR